MYKKKILLVDDEPEFVSMLKMRLEANGYEVVTSCDGKSGLEAVQTENPNLLILDVMMPGMDGFQVLRQIRRAEKTRYLPVIMLTAKGESKSIFRSQELGVTDYLIKPFEPSELLAACAKHAR
jgi:DNA-binding response OmpR family regulator